MEDTGFLLPQFLIPTSMVLRTNQVARTRSGATGQENDRVCHRIFVDKTSENEALLT